MIKSSEVYVLPGTRNLKRHTCYNFGYLLFLEAKEGIPVLNIPTFRLAVAAIQAP